MTQQDKERIEKDASNLWDKGKIMSPSDYIAGATAEHEQLKIYERQAEDQNATIVYLNEQLKQERNKAVDIYKQALHMLNDYANTGIADREYRNSLRDLIYKIKSGLTAHGEH